MRSGLSITKTASPNLLTSSEELDRHSLPRPILGQRSGRSASVHQHFPPCRAPEPEPGQHVLSGMTFGLAVRAAGRCEGGGLLHFLSSPHCELPGQMKCFKRSRRSWIHKWPGEFHINLAVPTYKDVWLLEKTGGFCHDNPPRR